MLCCLLQKFQRVTSSHDQVLAELETANRDLQTEQNKVISLQNQLKLGSSSSIVIAEVTNLRLRKFLRKFLVLFKNCIVHYCPKNASKT